MSRHVRVASLDKRQRWDIVPFAWRLVSELKHWRPSILHCYLVEPCLFGLAVGRLAGVPAVVWGVRASNVDYSRYGLISLLTAKVAARLSACTDLIVANSDAGRAYWQTKGYSRRRFVTIHNGIDVDRFRPSDEARWRSRQQWHVGDDEFVVGVSARLDPLKDHSTLLIAAAKVLRQRPNVRFVCCGDGRPAYLEQLRSQASALGIADRVVWAGEHDGMESVYPAFDIGCSCSATEGFSNAIGEAMACGVACVVTDTGDSAAIVGDTGHVVPPGDADALACAILEASVSSPADRLTLGLRARQRIVDHYTTALMIERTSAAYEELARCSARSDV